jgi:hypothetical protein
MEMSQIIKKCMDARAGNSYMEKLPYRSILKEAVYMGSLFLLLSLNYVDLNLLSSAFYPTLFIVGTGLVLTGFYFTVAKVIGKGNTAYTCFIFLYQV